MPERKGASRPENNPWNAPLGDLVYDEVCPLCDAQKGQPCVYIWPKGVNPFGWRHTKGVQASIDRVGQPITRAHNERMNLARDRLIATWRKTRRLNKPQVVRVSARVLAIQRAHTQFDLAEYEAMRDWLRVNGRLLIDLGSPKEEQ